MRSKPGLIFLFLLIIKSPVSGQDTFVDKRDDKEYPTITINGTVWMQENLDFVTDLSKSSEPQQAKNPQLKGRYYHLDDICCACPSGWRLPNVGDWLGYFSYVLKSADSLAPLKFLGLENHFAIDGYSDKLDLFGEGNPLRLTETGMVEGGKYTDPLNNANYWTLDPHEWGHTIESSPEDHTHVLTKVYEGKTHIHIRDNGFTNIHSHNHHLDTRKEKKLRYFMIRCVKAAVKDK